MAFSYSLLRSDFFGFFSRFVRSFTSFLKFWDVSRPVRTCSDPSPDPFGHIQMHSDAFGRVRTISEKIEISIFLGSIFEVVECFFTFGEDYFWRRVYEGAITAKIRLLMLSK